MTKSYDAAIAGAGVFGSWIAYHLRQPGLRVALIDPYGPGNSRASSGGESRIIRMGYGPDEIYTQWSKRSLALWKGVFDRIGESIFHRTGVLWMAREKDPYTTATIETLKKVRVEFEELNKSELEHRYPQINFGEIGWAVYEPESGALMARRAVQALALETIDNGVEYFCDEVMAPAGSGDLAEITTRGGRRISAGTFIFSSGPWLPKLFPVLLKERIHPTRQEVFFFGTPAGNSRFRSPQMPIWIDFGAQIYGLPDLENRGFKIALDRHGPSFDPDTDDRTASEEILKEVRQFLYQRFPEMENAPVVESRVCQYENTSNGDLLIDRHPDFTNVWLIGGGSGHGFKHGPALGEYVAARILEGGEIEKRFTLATKGTVRKRSIF
jgi:sarcosine oxidase